MGRAQATAETLLERRSRCQRDSLTLYRCGSLKKARSYPAQAELYDLADALRPASRAGRLQGLFCATASEIQWWADEQHVTWQLQVEGDVWAYPLDVWREIYFRWERTDQADMSGQDILEREILSWWQQGILLTPEADLGSYEALVLPEQIVARRRLGIGRQTLVRHQLPYTDAHPTWTPA